MQERSLGSNAGSRFMVVQCGHQSRSLRVILTGFDSERALPYRRKHHIRFENLSDFAGEAETIHARHRQHNRVEFTGLQFLEAGIHIPPHINHIEIATVAPELRLPPKAAGPNSRANA
jgi:hypothetical protein